jgi:hypothetical protein
LADAARSVIELAEFKDGFFPYQGADIKTALDKPKQVTAATLRRKMPPAVECGCILEGAASAAAAQEFSDRNAIRRMFAISQSGLEPAIRLQIARLAV